MHIGVGAGPMSMANSTIASVQDITAGYWNPAGLVNIQREYEVGLMHSEYFAGIAKYDYIAGAKKLDEKSSAGISIIRFGVDDIPNTLELIDSEGNIRYDRIKTFSVADYALIASYSRKSPVEGLVYGGNVKIIYRQTGDFANSWGFGLDAGIQYQRGKWQFGAVGKDITSTFNAWSFNNDQLKDVFETTGNEIPTNSLEITMPRLILGTGRGFPINEKITGFAEVNVDVTFDGKRHVLVNTSILSIDPHLGVQFDYKKIVFLRGGLGNIQTIPGFDHTNTLSFQPNFGVGVHYQNFAIDYALTDISKSIALYSNIFSFSYSFNTK